MRSHDRPDEFASTSEDSLALLARAQAGDGDALETLLQRYRPRLSRWIRGRLPTNRRALSDTDDLVQDTLIRVTRILPTLEIRHEAGLQAYFRQAIWNRLREEVRAAPNRVQQLPIEEALAAPGPSPLETAIGHEALQRYETALASLDADDRSAVIGRLEFGHSYPELAVLLNRRSADAARKVVERALTRLVGAMTHVG